MFRRFWQRLRKLERHELRWLLIGLGVSIGILGFLILAGEVVEGDTLEFDLRVVRAFRNPTNPSQSIGPLWLEWSVRDITALGGPTVISLVVLAVVGFLTLQSRYRTALFVLATAAGGESLNRLLKVTFDRARPSVVPDLHVLSPSFPSGHAMQSAIVYLTLGAVLMRVADRPVTKAYCLGSAIFLTMLIGMSRIFLGVHYPSDVAAGWIVGFAWASVCWTVEDHYGRRVGIEAEKQKE